MGLDDYIVGEKSTYDEIDRHIYYSISDERLEQWRQARLARRWHRRLWRWVTGLWKRWRDWWVQEEDSDDS